MSEAALDHEDLADPPVVGLDEIDRQQYKIHALNPADEVVELRHRRTGEHVIVPGRQWFGFQSTGKPYSPEQTDAAEPLVDEPNKREVIGNIPEAGEQEPLKPDGLLFTHDGCYLVALDEERDLDAGDKRLVHIRWQDAMDSQHTGTAQVEQGLLDIIGDTVDLAEHEDEPPDNWVFSEILPQGSPGRLIFKFTQESPGGWSERYFEATEATGWEAEPVDPPSDEEPAVPGSTADPLDEIVIKPKENPIVPAEVIPAGTFGSAPDFDWGDDEEDNHSEPEPVQTADFRSALLSGMDIIDPPDPAEEFRQSLLRDMEVAEKPEPAAAPVPIVREAAPNNEDQSEFVNWIEGHVKRLWQSVGNEEYLTASGDELRLLALAGIYKWSAKSMEKMAKLLDRQDGRAKRRLSLSRLGSGLLIWKKMIPAREAADNKKPSRPQLTVVGEKQKAKKSKAESVWKVHFPFGPEQAKERSKAVFNDMGQKLKRPIKNIQRQHRINSHNRANEVDYFRGYRGGVYNTLRYYAYSQQEEAQQRRRLVRRAIGSTVVAASIYLSSGS